MGTQELKRTDWDIRLMSYIDDVRNEPFQWGVHDCLTFANGATTAQCGSGFADDCLLCEYETPRGALLKFHRWMRANDYSDIVEAVDDRLNRIYAKFLPRGAIVGMPQASNDVLPFSFGVSIGQHCAFVAAKGLIFLKPRSDFLCWGLE